VHQVGDQTKVNRFFVWDSKLSKQSAN